MKQTTRKKLMELVYTLHTEADTPVLQALSVGIGLVIGSVPLYGLHLPLCIVVARVFNLSRLKMYLVTFLNNPFVAPFLIYSEIQVGSLIRRGQAYEMSLEGLTSGSPWVFANDLLFGSLVVGACLGVIGGVLVYLLSVRSAKCLYRRSLIEQAGRKYLDVGFIHWEIVRNRLHFDVVYLETLTRGWLPSNGLLVDLGCGRGTLLAMIKTYCEDRFANLRPVDCAPPPVELDLLGVEERHLGVDAARRAGFQVERADLRTFPLPRCRCVVLFDVLHLLEPGEQRRLLERAVAALEPGGVLLVREADSSQHWRFMATRLAERLRAFIQGRPLRRFHFRSADEWALLLGELGLEAKHHDMQSRIPSSNTVLRASTPLAG